MTILSFILGDADHRGERAGVFSFHVAVDGLHNLVFLQIRMSKSTPDFWQVNLLSVFSSSWDVIDIVDQDLHGFDVEVLSTIDFKGFFIKLIVGAESDLSDGRAVVVIQTLHVVHDPGFVGLDRGDE